MLVIFIFFWINFDNRLQLSTQYYTKSTSLYIVMRTNPCIKTNTEKELEEQQSTQFINSYAVVHVAYIM